MSWEEEIEKINNEAFEEINKKISELTKKEDAPIDYDALEKFTEELNKMSQDFNIGDSDC